jgi:type VI secretion system protein
MLTLTVIQYRQMPPDQITATRFDQVGGTIGRAANNDWVLPDPEQHLSKRHCQIDYRDGRYLITDTSSNGVFVNGGTQPLGPHKPYMLCDGDRLVLGDFIVEARIASVADSLITPQLRIDTRIDPFAAQDDPFGLSRWEDTPSRPAGYSEPTPTTGPRRFDEDSDDDFWGPINRDNERAPLPDHLPLERESIRIAPAVEETPLVAPLIPDDWDKSPLIDPPPIPSLRMNGRSAPDSETVEPPPEPSSGARETAEPLPIDEAAMTDAGLLAAFLEGAGIGRLDLSDQDPREVMRRAGEITRVAIEGLREVLVARAKLKEELRLTQTVIKVSGNNPVKFSLGVNETLAALLGPQQPGYMRAVPAVRQGFKDLKSHEMATLAAFQAALAKLFQDFDPERLKQRLDRPSVLESIVPGLRKAGYWELYEALYRKIAQEMAEDLQGMFGREFARAYEDQVQKLRENPDRGLRSWASRRERS